MRGCEDPVVRAKRVSCRGEPSNCQERLYQNSVKTEKECEMKVNFMSTGTLSSFRNLQCVDFNVYVAALKPECTFYTWEEKVYKQEFL